MSAITILNIATICLSILAIIISLLARRMK